MVVRAGHEGTQPSATCANEARHWGGIAVGSPAGGDDKEDNGEQSGIDGVRSADGPPAGSGLGSDLIPVAGRN